MDIHAGDQVIAGAEVFSERVWHMGVSRPALRVRLSGALSQAQLDALATQPWELYDGDELVGRHTGYTALISHELRMAAVGEAEAEVEQANAQARAAQTRAQQLERQLDGELAQLRAQGAQLEQRLSAAAQGVELLENCMIELAGAVYA